MTDQHLPAAAAPASGDATLASGDTAAVLAVPAVPGEDELLAEPRRPLRVALLPLALVTFIILAFVIAAWTFLAAAT